MSKTLRAICVLASVAGCASWLPTPVPMRSIDYPSAVAPARCLMVFLPGLGDSGARFDQRGFVADVRAQHPSIDMTRDGPRTRDFVSHRSIRGDKPAPS